MTTNTVNIADTTLRNNLAALLAMLPEKFQLHALADKAEAKPRESLLVLLGITVAAFYFAERSENEKVNTIFDAMEYCTSSMSVGYTNIYPQTPLGKMVGSLLMTIGPSMVDNLLSSKVQANPVQEEMLATLKQILERLPEQTQTVTDK